MKELTLTYEQDMDDLVAFCFYAYKNRKAGVFFSGPAGLLSLGALAAYLCYQHFWRHVSFPPAYLLWFGIMALYILSFRVKSIYRMLHYYKFSMRKNGIVLGEIILTLGEKEIQAWSQESQATFAWNRFNSYVEAKDHFFLYSGADSGVLIPKRILLLEQELYDVKSFVEYKLAEKNK